MTRTLSSIVHTTLGYSSISDMNLLTIVVVFVSFCGALATEKRANNIGTHCLDSADCFCDHHQVPFCDQHHQCACRDAGGAPGGRQAVECTHDADCFTVCHNNHGTCTNQHTCLCHAKRADNIGTHCLDSGDCFCDKHQVPFCDQHHQCACRDAAAVGRQAVECANDADCFTLCHNNHGTCTHQHQCVCHARQAVECTHDADCFTVCHNNHGTCTNQHTCLCHAKRANNIGDHCVDAAACFCDHHDIPTCVNHQCGCTPH